MSEKTELTPIIGTEDETRRGDVVFVHGLGGDGRGTWHPEEKKDDNNFWPSNSHFEEEYNLCSLV